jgi:hypothetical protein
MEPGTRVGFQSAPSRSTQNSSAMQCARFCVGGVSVQIEGARETDVALGFPLEPFRIEAGPSDIHIRVDWTSGLPLARGAETFDSGGVWRLHERAGGFRFDFSARHLGERPYKRLLVDDSFRCATLQMSEECFTRVSYPVEPLEYPLDELLIMHRLTQERAIELHSCGIVRPDGTGNLFVGHSGAGKSTTTRLWTEQEDVEVLSDDRIIVRRDEVRGGGDRSGVETPGGIAGAEELQQVVRLRDGSASRTSHFAQDDRADNNRRAQRDGGNTKHLARAYKGKTNSQIRMYGTPWHGEAMYASPGSAPLTRMFILEHGQGNVITRLPPSQAVAELFARSFVPFHRHDYVDSALDFLQELVAAVPCYHYAFEPNQRAVETILNFHD